MDKQKITGILHWLSRWPRWLLISIKKMGDINLSANATIEYLIPVAMGSVVSVVAIFSLIIFTTFAWYDHNHNAVSMFVLVIVLITSFFAYFLVGLALFFNKRLQISNTLPWYKNGAW